MITTKELIKLRLDEDIKSNICFINDDNYTDDKTIVSSVYFTNKVPKFVWNDIKRLWITGAAYYPLRVEIDYIHDKSYKESLCPLEDIIILRRIF